MSAEELNQAFYYMQWKDGVPTTFVSSPFVKIKKDNCFQILPVDLVGLLEKEREKSKRLISELRKALPHAPMMNGEESFTHCQKVVSRALREYEKEGAE